MPAGRPRLPTELKKLKGTLNVTDERRSNEAQAEKNIKQTELLIDATSITCPKSITDRYCKRYWKTLTKGLLSIGVISGNDIPQLEQLVLTLQKLRQKQEQWLNCPVDSDEWDDIDKQYERLVNRFERLGNKYYISPVARSKIRLEDLNIKEKEINIAEKQESAISSLFANREKYE